MSRLLKIVLSPLAMLYGLVVIIRNKLFDHKILKSTEFKVPVITVGNITVGGTGKTPHTEYLIRLLKPDFKIALLSRGYKRKTSDFRVADINSTFEEIGDEPFQVKKKFPEIMIAVDRNRVNGIQKIIEQQPDTDIILLDDGYQHRWVTPGIAILLVDYNRPIFNDSFLPLGELREPASEKRRANVIIITKFPENISAIDKRLFLNKIDVQPHQKVFFTKLKYGALMPVFGESEKIKSEGGKESNATVLLVTGIAQPEILADEIKKTFNLENTLKFPDHHNFTPEDVEKINSEYEKIDAENKIIITTEKDAVRLRSFGNLAANPAAWFYIPVEIEFLPSDDENFKRYILHYVKNNHRNSILFKK